MQIKEIKGDLIQLFKEKKFDIIVHGCNCFNVMGAGIASQIKQEFPEAFEADAKFLIPVKSFHRLGNYSYSVIGHPGRNAQWIVNAYTQYNPGQNLDYNALELVLKKINRDFAPERIGLPLIGCGIAGGKWHIVRKIIERQLKDCDITIVHYDSNSI